MKTHDYDTDHNKNTGGTETHVAVDTKMKKTIKEGSSKKNRLPYEEGFASASGIRPETASSGGRIKYPEAKDDSRPDRIPDSIEKENPGLADN